MSVRIHAVFKGISAVENGKVVDEAQIARLHAHRELVLLGEEVHRIQGFGLRLGDWRQTLGARRSSTTSKQPSREAQDDISLVEIKQRAAVVGRVSPKTTSP